MIPQEADQTHIEYGFPVVLIKKKRVWQHYILDIKQIVNFSSNQLPHKNLFCFMIEICSHSSKFLRISVNGVQKYRSK